MNFDHVSDVHKSYNNHPAQSCLPFNKRHGVWIDLSIAAPGSGADVNAVETVPAAWVAVSSAWEGGDWSLMLL